MSPNSQASNPFALMTAPEAVFAAIERSERLARLKSTICRPLDKPRPEKPLTEAKAFDEEVESTEIVEAPEATLDAADAAGEEPFPSLIG